MSHDHEYEGIDCPECHKVRTIVIPASWIDHKVSSDRIMLTVGAPLYQVSYPGSPEYTSPRCGKCMSALLYARARREPNAKV